MATAEQARVTETTTDEVVNAVVDAGTSVAPKRYFTIPGGTRSTRSSGSFATPTSLARTGRRSSRRRRVPEVLVADRDEHRRAEVLPRPHGLARARALRQADDRPRRRHDRRLGQRRRLLRDRRGGRHLRGRAEGDPRQPVRLLQLARSGSTSASRRSRSARPASSSRSTTRWSRSSTGSGARASSSAAAPARASTSRGSAPRRSSSRRAATRPAPSSFMRGADASAGTIKSGGKTRRAAKMVVLDVDHPDVEEFIWCKAKEERKARVLEQAGYDMSLDSPDWASIQYQNANNSVRVTDEFMEAVDRGQGVEPHRAHRRHRRRDDRRARACSARSPRRRGSAPIRASSTTRRSTPGTRSRTRAGSTRRTRAPSTCPSTTPRATSPRSTS